MKPRQITVCIPEQVARLVERFVASRNASTVETFIEDQIAGLAREIRSEAGAPGEEPDEQEVMPGYL